MNMAFLLLAGLATHAGGAAIDLAHRRAVQRWDRWEEDDEPLPEPPGRAARCCLQHPNRSERIARAAAKRARRAERRVEEGRCT